MRHVWIEGEGVITEHGTFHTEDQIRSALDVIRQMIDWVNALPPETRDVLRWEAEMRGAE